MGKDMSCYNVSIVDLSYRFTFKDSVKCNKIKLGDYELWNHSDDPKFADIKILSLDLPTNSFLVLKNLITAQTN
ncbi:SfiI-subtelomeric fragment related protein family member, putative [Theileria annulata]|uniref:SfiI-subtelomeric related protein family member, putative n=1 Tax=Theileria annulata TaxID=5874 RepID=Q4UBL1_THEAN|nr:SfiI-subtelomeric fragment related protein family member, putative [Theileria annulata]CAI75790.1 SfiI-subtelomeric fragment related protein family member, putative [Theileria annulata]